MPVLRDAPWPTIYSEQLSIHPNGPGKRSSFKVNHTPEWIRSAAKAWEALVPDGSVDAWKAAEQMRVILVAEQNSAGAYWWSN